MRDYLVGISPNNKFDSAPPAEVQIGEFDELKKYMSYPKFSYDLIEYGWYIRKSFPYHNELGSTDVVVVNCKDFISPDFPFFCFADLNRAIKFCNKLSPNHSSAYFYKLWNRYPLYRIDVIGDIKIKDLRIQLC